MICKYLQMSFSHWLKSENQHTYQQIHAITVNNKAKSPQKHWRMKFWLVVWTPLKNISQLGWLFPIYGKIKNVPNHQPEFQWPKLHPGGALAFSQCCSSALASSAERRCRRRGATNPRCFRQGDGGVAGKWQVDGWEKKCSDFPAVFDCKRKTISDHGWSWWCGNKHR